MEDWLSPNSDNASFYFRRDGAQRCREALAPETLAAIETALVDLPPVAGTRLHGLAALAAILTPSGAVGQYASEILGPSVRAVRAVLFDKNPGANWALGWHQDRTIVVRQRFDVDGFGPWSIKAGFQHVAPPFDLLAEMVTLRLHLDDVDDANAPLKVAVGSHRHGRVPESEIGAVVADSDVMTCLACRGDVWRYATPILHASDAAREPRRRRVLQVDYCARDLPGGLEWLGV
jgi:hypothetical protein